MKTRFLCITLLCFLPHPAAAQTAEEVVKKALDARGGADKIKAFQSERITGRMLFAPDAEGTFVVELKRPQKMHSEIFVDGQTIIRVYDGKGNGWVVNPFAENKDVQPMSAEDLKTISDEAEFDGPLLDYRSKGNQVELVAKEDLGGTPVCRLKLTNKNGYVRFYLFDASTFLLLKWEGIRKTDGKELPWESFFSDFREVNGLKYAFKIDQDSPGSDIHQTLITEKIELDPQIDDSRFAKPRSPAPPADSPPPTSIPPPSASPSE
jgi:hypothetical protein